MTRREPAGLLLEDGRFFAGQAFGARGETSGEVVFNTSMTGYQEILTDPSYRAQIVTMTYPHIGNYGVNPADAESGAVQAAGLIVREVCEEPSNWRASSSLDAWMRRHKLIGLTGNRYALTGTPPAHARGHAGRAGHGRGRPQPLRRGHRARAVDVRP
jgi:carbamoyl-phosphate synthase small subunit